jgi:pyridoxine 5-phosphate synthase
MTKLGVNIDHVATLRQARKEFEPDPVQAAILCENAGADSIVCHLREDRRHINDKDILSIRKAIKGWFNLELSLNPKIIQIALKTNPDQVTFVPEKREELTTEGGLNVVKYAAKIKKAAKLFQKKNIDVSLFIEANRAQIKKAKDIGATIIEIHTGHFDHAKNEKARKKELEKIRQAAAYAKSLGLIVHAGHGLKYNNAKEIASIDEIEELNIGHSNISRSKINRRRSYP